MGRRPLRPHPARAMRRAADRELDAISREACAAYGRSAEGARAFFDDLAHALGEGDRPRGRPRSARLSRRGCALALVGAAWANRERDDAPSCLWRARALGDDMARARVFGIRSPPGYAHALWAFGCSAAAARARTDLRRALAGSRLSRRIANVLGEGSPAPDSE